MKPANAFRTVWAALLLAVYARVYAGTWSDHFSSDTLIPEWTGDRNSFRIINKELDGISVSPVAPSPFHLVEISQDSTDCSIGVWVNVVARNTAVCSKGAIVARHTGTKGYVFALHEATQTAEIYRLATNDPFGHHEMLLSKPWKIDLGTWHYARVELQGPDMSFFIDGALVGSITDSDSPSGSVGLTVQDVSSTKFDDFTITGPNVVGNVDDVPKPEVISTMQTEGQVVLKFNAVSPYDYFVQASSSPSSSHDWQTIATFRAKFDLGEISVTDPVTNVVRFYRVEKVPCYCR